MRPRASPRTDRAIRAPDIQFSRTVAGVESPAVSHLYRVNLARLAGPLSLRFLLPF